MKQESLLEPKIGPLREKVEPELFTDREEILKKIWDWAMLIKRRVASPAALFGQRRMGKTAVLRRLYNKLFWEQDEIVPIYYEVERK
ncbi:MAG: hypothetical protein ACE5PV_27845, partial [Candidatus Poribacteria bacterium]